MPSPPRKIRSVRTTMRTRVSRAVVVNREAEHSTIGPQFVVSAVPPGALQALRAARRPCPSPATASVRMGMPKSGTKRHGRRRFCVSDASPFCQQRST